jgi:uncharacterized membrane protein
MATLRPLAPPEATTAPESAGIVATARPIARAAREPARAEGGRLASATFDRALAGVCALWVGVMAGFFFAFSVVVMPGFDEADPLTAMAAMQAINDAVQNAVFFLGFFGAPVLCLAVIARGLVRRDRAGWLGVAAGVAYLVGVFGVTVGFNVPLNDDLAALDPTLPANAPAMGDYIREWTAWNHVRTVAGVVAFALLTVGLVLDRGPGVARGAPA